MGIKYNPIQEKKEWGGKRNLRRENIYIYNKLINLSFTFMHHFFPQP